MAKFPARAAALGLALLGSLPGCEDLSEAIDPFPISMDRRSGGILIAAATDDGEPALVALDTLSPVTLFAPEGDDRKTPLRRRAPLTLYGQASDGGLLPPRVRFDDVEIVSRSLCPEPPCEVGTPEARRPVGGVIGADLLSRYSLRVDFESSSLRFFPDAAGDDESRGEACEAVFTGPYHGGGTYVVGGVEDDFDGLRPALGVCMDEGRAEALEARGVDGSFVLSTAMGPSVIAASAYDRYANAAAAPARSSLPAGTLHLPSGVLRGQWGQISHLAIVGSAGSDSLQRGPCRELYANRVLKDDLCSSGDAPIATCPCPDGDSFCRVGAAVELDRAIRVLIVPDSAPLLQALRFELRPAVPEIDGILGLDALAGTRLELDYPNDRLLLKCIAAACTTHPAIRKRSALADIARCSEGRELWTGEAVPRR